MRHLHKFCPYVATLVQRFHFNIPISFFLLAALPDTQSYILATSLPLRLPACVWTPCGVDAASIAPSAARWKRPTNFTTLFQRVKFKLRSAPCCSLTSRPIHPMLQTPWQLLSATAASACDMQHWISSKTINTPSQPSSTD